MRVEDVKDGVGPVPLRLLQLAPDLLPPGGGEDRDLLPGHGLAPLLHRHHGQGRHVWQWLLPLDGGVTQHLRVVIINAGGVGGGEDGNDEDDSDVGDNDGDDDDDDSDC